MFKPEPLSVGWEQAALVLGAQKLAVTASEGSCAMQGS